jgi:hypothetical protein
MCVLLTKALSSVEKRMPFPFPEGGVMDDSNWLESVRFYAQPLAKKRNLLLARREMLFEQQARLEQQKQELEVRQTRLEQQQQALKNRLTKLKQHQEFVM